MGTNSLNEFSSFVNQQMSSIENLDEHLTKACALLEVALQHDFSEFSEETIRNYLWALNDIIVGAYRCCKQCLTEVFAANKLVNTAAASHISLGETNNDS